MSDDRGRPSAPPQPLHEPALPRDKHVYVAVALVLLGFFGGLGLLLFLIATDV